MRAHTHYLMNIFTMNSPDPDIQAGMKAHRAKIFNYFAPVFATISLVYCITDLLDPDFHPAFKVSKVALIFISVALYAHYFCVRKDSWGSFIMKVYYAIFAVSVILVYTDLIPESLKDKKDKLRYKNMMGYVLTIGCPGHHWLKTFLTLTPLWLAACYF